MCGVHLVWMSLWAVEMLEMEKDTRAPCCVELGVGRILLSNVELHGVSCSLLSVFSWMLGMLRQLFPNPSSRVK